MIRCIACSPPLDWEALDIATRHVQRAHRGLVQGLDGYELAFAIREVLRRVPVPTTAAEGARE